MVHGHALDLLLDLQNGFLAWNMLDSLGAVVGEDTVHFVVKYAAETDGAAPGVVALYASRNALGAVGEAALVHLWRELA